MHTAAGTAPKGHQGTAPTDAIALAQPALTSTAAYLMLHNNVSGPEVGLADRISAGFQLGKPQNRPSGWPSAGRRADFEALIRPKSGPEARFRKHYYYVTGWDEQRHT